jgi:hypothetical protein
MTAAVHHYVGALGHEYSSAMIGNQRISIYALTMDFENGAIWQSGATGVSGTELCFPIMRVRYLADVFVQPGRSEIKYVAFGLRIICVFIASPTIDT